MERARPRDPLTAAALVRLAFALLLSLSLHAVLLVRVEQGARQLELQPVIVARLVPAKPGAPAPPASPPQMLPPRAEIAAPAPVHAIDGLPAVSTPAPPDAGAVNPADTPSAEAMRPPVDLNYYPASELDVYPVPTQAISPRMETAAGGWIRILTMIGETGHVDDAVVYDADPPDVLDAPALEAVRHMRFYPARRNGRDVRSRVLIELRVPDSAAMVES